MLNIEFSSTPTLRQLKNYILALERYLATDLTDYWTHRARPLVAEEIARIFATQGYGKWAPLSPKYALWKAKRYPGRTVLRREDHYFKSATRKGPGNVFEVRPDRMTWGIDIGYFSARFGFPYPVVHESGGVRMPQRPVFEIATVSAALQNRLVVSLKTYLYKKIMAEAKRHFTT